MIRSAAMAALLAVLAVPGTAQQAVVDPATVTSCLAATPIGSIDPPCIGAASNACQSATPDGQTTLGITECIRAETEVWDKLLNQQYATARKDFSAQPGLADQLRDAQRAWIAFRDAECALAYSVWGDGSMRTIAAANCDLVMTARRTVELRDMQ